MKGKNRDYECMIGVNEEEGTDGKANPPKWRENRLALPLSLIEAQELYTATV